MKKIMLCLVSILCINHMINAQDSDFKSYYILGGSANFIIQNNTYPISSLTIISGGTVGIFTNDARDSKNTYGSISPRIGRQINEHWLLGAQLYLARGKYDTEITDFTGTSTINLERTTRDLGFGIFGRYTINPQHRFQAILQPVLSYNTSNEDENFDGMESNEKASFIQVNIGLGGLYKISERFNATVNLGGLNFVSGNWENDLVEQDFSSFGANFSSTTVVFGLEYKL